MFTPVLLFVIGLPIALAKKAHARAVMESLVIYLTFNYFVSSILQYFGDSFGMDFSADLEADNCAIEIVRFLSTKNVLGNKKTAPLSCNPKIEVVINVTVTIFSNAMWSDTIETIVSLFLINHL